MCAGAAMLFAACSKDNTETPAKARSLDFEVSYELQGDATDLGLSWSSADASKLGIITSKGVVKSSKIEGSGQSATFTAEVMDNETEVYCFYPANDKATVDAAEVSIAASRTDDAAGAALSGQLPMVSQAVALTRDTEKAPVEMTVVPAVLRIYVYSSEAEYQSESVSSVSVNAAEKINGTYSWSFTSATGSVVNGTNTSSVKFTNRYELDGISSADDAAVVNLPVAPVALTGGYEISIATQKATYVYTGTEKAFEMGKVYDIEIDLKEVERNAKDIITFDASALQDVELAANGSTKDTEGAYAPESIGTFSALVNGTPSTDYTKDYYQSLTFEVTDAEGNAATWLTPSVGENGALMMAWEINPAGEPRTANIVATYNSSDDVYYENPAFTFSVTQLKSVVNYKITNLSKNYLLKATAQGFGETDLGYFHAFVNAEIDAVEKTPASEFQWYNLQIKCQDAEGNDIDWLQAYVKEGNDHLFLTCSENKDTSSRTGSVLLFNPLSGEQIMQADGTTPLVYTVEQKGFGEKSALTYKWNSQFNGAIPGEGVTDQDFGYYQAYIDGSSTAEPTSSAYYDVTYTYVDDNGEPVDWLSAKRGATNHPLVTCQPNAGGIRRATVLAHYQDDYTVVSDPAFSFVVTQGPAAGMNYVTYTWYSDDVKEARQSGYNDWDLGYYQAFVNGSSTNEYAANGNVYTPRYDITITLEPADATWLEVRSNYKEELEKNPASGGNNHLRCKMEANDTGAVREVTVKAHYSNAEYSSLDPIFTFVIRQAAE